MLDDVGIHKVKVVAAWLTEHRRVELFPPRYSGHRQNPVFNRAGRNARRRMAKRGR